MTEVAGAGEHHGDPALVGRVDHFLVAHRAARLDDAGGAGVADHVQAVAEREERVAGDGGALERQARVMRFAQQREIDALRERASDN